MADVTFREQGWTSRDDPSSDIVLSGDNTDSLKDPIVSSASFEVRAHWHCTACTLPLVGGPSFIRRAPSRLSFALEVVNIFQITVTTMALQIVVVISPCC